jgi:hypothetical protein
MYDNKFSGHTQLEVIQHDDRAIFVFCLSFVIIFNKPVEGRNTKLCTQTDLKQRFSTFFHGRTHKIHFHIPRNPNL